jgi:O-antigen/teichoic acid export membrane protein
MRHLPNVNKNVIANYLGQGWSMLMGLAFVPLYIKYLGVESYGLIGIFALLQTWLGLFDVGMTPTLSREMARFKGGGRGLQFIRDLLRSIEFIGFTIAAMFAFSIWGTSSWLASNWLQGEKLPVQVIAQAISLMGFVTALRFIENIYRSSIVGLQRQVLLNIILSSMATFRGLGAVGILIWVSPTIEAFFIWQGIISITSVSLFAIVLYSTLPAAEDAAHFSINALKEIRYFAGGVMAISFLAFLMTQIDKILLSRLLTLEAFGYYALAGMISNTLYMFSGPVAAAFFPHFTELVERDDLSSLIAEYHKGSQIITVLMGTAAIVLIVFGDILISLWMANPKLALRVAPLVSVLSLGTLLNGLVWIPHYVQLAYGWTSLNVRINIVSVCVIVPAIFWLVPIYGSIGAAWAWVGLNVGYVTIGIHFMHRRLLITEKWRWYRQDIFSPLIAGTVIAVVTRWVMPDFSSIFAQLFALLIAAGLVLVASALAAKIIRQYLVAHLSRIIAL